MTGFTAVGISPVWGTIYERGKEAVISGGLGAIGGAIGSAAPDLVNTSTVDYLKTVTNIITGGALGLLMGLAPREWSMGSDAFNKYATAFLIAVALPSLATAHVQAEEAQKVTTPVEARAEPAKPLTNRI